VNLLCVFDQPLQQRRWRVAEILAEFVEDETGVRPEGRRPALRRKHDPSPACSVTSSNELHGSPAVTATLRTVRSSLRPRCLCRTRPGRTVSSTHGTATQLPTDTGISALSLPERTPLSTDLSRTDGSRRRPRCGRRRRGTASVSSDRVPLYGPRLNSTSTSTSMYVRERSSRTSRSCLPSKGMARPRHSRNSAVITGFAFCLSRLTK